MYALSSTDISGYLTGSTMPKLTQGNMNRIALLTPPLREQRAIAQILGTLDDKIEVNRRMNETLEATARSLFKSWFVDFDPVRAKAEGHYPGLPQPLADLFPDSFEDSELGEIPTGWRVGRFGDVVEQLRDQENPTSSPEALYHHFSLPAFDEGQSPKAEYGESIKSQKSRVPAGVVLLSKLNPEIERVWLVDVHPNERAVCSTEFLVLRARSPFTRSFVYCLTRSPLFRQLIEGLVTGTSKSHQRARVDSILTLAVVVPPSPLVAAFDRAVDCLLSRTLVCRCESRALSALRDVLLPELISGKLRIEDVQKFVERAAS
jgi:type I restriction enzyme S subunit